MDKHFNIKFNCTSVMDITLMSLADSDVDPQRTAISSTSKNAECFVLVIQMDQGFLFLSFPPFFPFHYFPSSATSTLMDFL